MTTIYESFATNYAIAKGDNNTYYAFNLNEPEVHYEITEQGWKYKGEGRKYINMGTKVRIIRSLANRSVGGKIKDYVEFLQFYNSLKVEPTFGPNGDDDIQLSQEDFDSIVNAQFITEEQEVQGENRMSEELGNAILEKLEALNKPSQLETQMIEAIIEKGKDIATKDLEENVKEKLNEFIKSEYGVLPQTIEVVGTPNPKPITGLFHNRYENLLKMVYAKVPTMLVGPAGSGKNHTLEQIAEALSLDFYFTNAVTQEHKLTGFVDAHGKYHETEFYKAFTNGGMFFFDEIDASIPDSLIIVNAAIANGYFDFPNGRVNAHEDFRIVAAANTFGHGADAVYVGRSQLDGATLDRFAVVEFNYDANVEQSLAQDDDLYNLVYSLRKTINQIGLRYTMSTRAIINAKKMIMAGLTHEDAVQFGIIKSINKDDLQMISSKIELNKNDWSKAFNNQVHNKE